MDATYGKGSGMLGAGGPGRGSGRAEGAGLGSLRGRARSGPPCRRFLPESLRCLALRSTQRLRGVGDFDHIVYVELWVLHALFGQDSEMLVAFYGWFRVSLVVRAVPGCGVLVFIIGSPLYQYVTKFLIMAMSLQLRIRRNRARARTRQLLNSVRAWRRSD